MGSYLGMFWALLRPLLFILVMWFVFSVGFKSGSKISEFPFVLWLMAGIIPWFFFSEALSKVSNSIVANSYLVKRTGFPISTLPIIKIFSALTVHAVFVIILFSIFILSGYYPTKYWLQIPFYTACSVLLLLGLGWLVSSLKVFIKDIGEIIGLVIQFGFWVTPIFWSSDSIPSKYQFFINLNPLVYIIEGYRNSLISNKWFWEVASDKVLSFYCISLLFLIVGVYTFKKLEPHFGDVL